MGTSLFKINDKVDGNFEVERATTKFIVIDIDNNDIDVLVWRINEIAQEVLSLDEILRQIRVIKRELDIPFIRLLYETSRWGVIFEVGNYLETGSQWVVHGVTKGYS